MAIDSGPGDYVVPRSLTILSGIFLFIGAVFAVLIILDMIIRKGWRSMMWIMIPVWPINALYLGPFAAYVYYKYGRPPKPVQASSAKGHNHSEKDHAAMDHSNMHHQHEAGAVEDAHSTMHHDHSTMHHEHMDPDAEKAAAKAQRMHDMHAMHHATADRPNWATIAMGVCHCGAGCVLGDIVGEWLVFGTDAMINGQGLWVALLVDYGFALLFGIAFQYFSIAPMSGDYGVKSIVRAIKADFLSLTCFEIGLFGWMLIYQIGIWDYKLMTNTYLYWWQMQIGMILGYVTAWPINWWLIKKEIKAAT